LLRLHGFCTAGQARDVLAAMVIAQVRVAHNHRQRFVAEQIGNRSQGRTSHDQPAREGVAEIMRAHARKAGSPAGSTPSGRYLAAAHAAPGVWGATLGPEDSTFAVRQVG
jgi:hypothetical protein